MLSNLDIFPILLLDFPFHKHRAHAMHCVPPGTLVETLKTIANFPNGLLLLRNCNINFFYLSSYKTNRQKTLFFGQFCLLRPKLQIVVGNVA